MTFYRKSDSGKLCGVKSLYSYVRNIDFSLISHWTTREYDKPPFLTGVGPPFPLPYGKEVYASTNRHTHR